MSIILGAGLSGLIAATQFPNATVFEANGPEHLSHKAVLRFRTDALSRLTGIPFRKVTVRKSIWHEGAHVQPNIHLANIYSKKTNGAYLDRSIWNLDPVERYIAPEDLQLQMAEMIGNRIEWNHRVDSFLMKTFSRPIISTLPMPILMGIMEQPHAVNFHHQQILVDRYRVHDADVFQTIYYPASNFGAYRASITGNLLIVERTGKLVDDDLGDILESFGLWHHDVELIDESHAQRFGKIQPIDDAWRRNTIFSLTTEAGIYSLGRFAVWRNILLDDVVSDAAVIKRLMSAGKYGASLYHNNQKG
jgi:hypothetical protein